MNEEDFIRQSLYLQNLPVHDYEIPFIQHLLHSLNYAGNAIHAYPDLNLEDPITIVDKELMK
jgi:hypothetical protein